MILGGLLPLVEAKGDPLVKNIDIVKFEMGPTFPIWPGPITSFARAWSVGTTAENIKTTEIVNTTYLNIYAHENNELLILN